jgi:hypothetical protein
MGIRRLIPWVLVTAFASSLGIGCSSGSGAGTGTTQPGDPATPAGFCNGTFGKVVDTFDKTCSTADKQTDAYQFVFGFMQLIVFECPTVLEGSVSKGRASIDGQAAATCIAAYDEILKQVNLGNVENLDPSIAAACQSVVIGKQPLGAACSQPYECPSGATCVGRTATTDGTCQTPAIGEACGNGESESGEITITMNFGSHPDCATGAFCDTIFENEEFVDRCVALKADGDDCFEPEECLVDGCHLGKCSSAPPSSSGMECMSEDDCADGLYCDDSGTTSVCAPQKSSGEACSGGMFSDECAGQCNQPEGATSGTCAAFCGQG